MTTRKRRRQSKAAAAASQLGSWDRHAEKPAKKSNRGRPSARTIAAKLMADKRTESLTPERRSAIASAAGKAAPHPKKLRKCANCGRPFGAREMRKHGGQCPALDKLRATRRAANRR